MNLLTILEVAIGLMFIWFLLSMLVSAIQEFISNQLKWRSRDLEQAIRVMLEDPVIQNRSASPSVGQAQSLAEQFYSHPLVRHLSLDISQRKPSYIPTSQFAEVVLDLIVDAGKETSPIRHAADLAEEAIQGLKESAKETIASQFNELVGAAQAAMTQRIVDDASVKRLRAHAQKFLEKYPQLEPAVQDLLKTVDVHALNIRPLVGELLSGTVALSETNAELGHTLNVIVARAIQNAKDADDAIARVRTNVETWFDSSMSRLSGYYKRRVQRWAFAIGVIVALVLGLDSIAIGKTLWFDQTVRAVIVTEAQQTTRTAQTPEQLIGRLSSLQVPAGWTVKTDAAICRGYFGLNLSRCIYPAGLGAAADQLFRASFFQTLLGILITGIAAAQGAPFWFEILSKLVNMRSSGSSPSADKGRT